MSIKAEFVGGYGVRIGDRLFDKTQHTTYSGAKINKTGVVPALCRDLLAQGVDPAAIIEVYRDGMLCFAPAKVGEWAEVAYSEGDSPIHLTTYQENPFSAARGEHTARVAPSNGYPLESTPPSLYGRGAKA